jgi:RimJ/RimL family protein N-acetyltransferase
MIQEKTSIIAMTRIYSSQISEWKYDDIYSFYDHNEETETAYIDGTHYACTNSVGELIGYYCYGKNARIPTIEENVYNDNYLDFGLGLKPDLCGKRHGFSFVMDGLTFAKDNFMGNHFKLSVAVFSVRAIKVYVKVGFQLEQVVTNSYFKIKFLVMKYTF